MGTKSFLTHMTLNQGYMSPPAVTQDCISKPGQPLLQLPQLQIGFANTMPHHAELHPPTKRHVVLSYDIQIVGGEA
jgi:hypothetical protein